MKRTALVLALLTATQAYAAPKWLKKVGQITGHVAIGASTQLAVSRASGSFNNWKPGLVATVDVAIFKETADLIAKRDTPLQATEHALEIAAGSGIVIAVKH